MRPHAGRASYATIARLSPLMRFFEAAMPKMIAKMLPHAGYLFTYAKPATFCR